MPADMNTLRTKQITSLVTQEFGAAVATDSQKRTDTFLPAELLLTGGFCTILCKPWRLLYMKIPDDQQFLKHSNFTNRHVAVKVTVIISPPNSDG